MPKFTPIIFDGQVVELHIGQKRFSTLEEIGPFYLRALITFLSFQDVSNPTRLAPFSFTEFCQRCQVDQKSPQADDLYNFLKDVATGSMRTTDPKTCQVKELPLVSQALIIERNTR